MQLGHPVGEKNVLWKGNDAGYSAIHRWVARRLGAPKICSNCKTTEARVYDWANISKEYKRVLTDWIRLCRKCHQTFDKYSKQTMWDFKNYGRYQA